MIDEIEILVELFEGTLKLKREELILGKDMGEQGKKLLETALTALKTLFLKTIEECKPKDKIEKFYFHSNFTLGHEHNQAISTYYDNLRKRVK